MDNEIVVPNSDLFKPYDIGRRVTGTYIARGSRIKEITSTRIIIVSPPTGWRRLVWETQWFFRRLWNR